MLPFRHTKGYRFRSLGNRRGRSLRPPRLPPEIGKGLPTVAGSKMQPEEGSARSIGGAVGHLGIERYVTVDCGHFKLSMGDKAPHWLLAGLVGAEHLT